MNRKKHIKLYGIISQFLYACAGGIVGFVIGGPFISAAGVIIGALLDIFSRKAQSAFNKKK